MYWIFKDGHYLSIDDKSATAAVTLEQRQNFAGEKGDEVLLLEKTPDGWQFTAHFQITNVTITDLADDYKTIIITLDLIKNLKDQKLLEDYIYSLKRVTNFAYPIKHFSRKYSRLTQAEFEAILYDEIYLKRTILGTILNAMHPDHQESFLLFLAANEPQLLTGRVDIDRALFLLLVYLDFAVIKHAEYLRESVRILKRLFPDDVDSVGFGSIADAVAKGETQVLNQQMFNQQVRLIDELLPNLPGSSNIPLTREIQNVKDDVKFKRLFKDSKLPLTLA